MSKAANFLCTGASIGRIAFIGLFAWVTACERPAQAAPAGGGQRGARNLLMTIPNLSADAKTRIAHLTNTANMQTAPLRVQIGAIRKDLARLWAAEEPDKQTIASKRAELEGAMAKVRAIWADFFMQLHDVLTAPQRAWLAARAPGLHGSDAGPDLGLSPMCPCGEPPPAQHPGPLQEQ
jgi:Spy/CpxP family protein refolding chaperone